MATTTTALPIIEHETVYGGDSWTRRYTTQRIAAGTVTAVDTAGYTARMHIRRTRSDPFVYVVASTDNGRITTGIQTDSDGDEWNLMVHLTAEDVSQLPGGFAGVYDIEVTDTGGRTTTWVTGTFCVEGDVTMAEAALIHGELHNVRSYGAAGDGTTDDTAAFNAALADAAGGFVFVPAGEYAIAGSITPSSNVTLVGTGRGSWLQGAGAVEMFDLSSVQFVKFRDLRVSINGAGATAFALSNSFRCSWTRVDVDGSNASGSAADYTERGFSFESNAGDNRIIDCNINNLGTGIYTDAIMNYVTGTVFGSNRRGVYGGDPTGVLFRAGISLNNVTMVGTTGITEHHIHVAGSASEWWLNQVWMEKGYTAVEVGNASGGARSFSAKACRMSAITQCLKLRNARQAHIEDITFGNEAGTATPTELTIDATGAPTGFAANLRRVSSFDFAASDFPADWLVYGRGWTQVP